MLHACFVLFVLCFVYTLRYFYTLSGTNLLTICHSASCLFSAVFGLRKLKNEYSQNWTGQKPKFIFFPERYGKSKTRRRRTPGWPHPRWARVPPWPRPPGVWAPWPSTDIASFTYNKPPGIKP